MDTQNQSPHGGENCCTPKTALPGTNPNQNTPKTWTAGAIAIVAAIMASACCWLPLALLGLGVSAAGLSKFIVGARWVFVAIAAAALGLGFYFIYRRKAACAPDEVYAPSGLARFNRVMLWASAVLVLAFATFPYYGAPLLKVVNSGNKNINTTSPGADSSAGQAGTALARLTLYTYQIKGMDCQECANGLQAAIAKLPGVKQATVSYHTGNAQVLANKHFDPRTVIKAIGGIGYKTNLRTDNDPKSLEK